MAPHLMLAILLLGPSPTAWTPVAEGVDYGRFALGSGDSLAHVVRVDPRLALVRVHTLEPGEEPMGAQEWGERRQLVFATNAGMFAEDRRTHIGYFKVQGRELTRGVHPDYQSAFLLHPVDASLPVFRMIDMDESALDSVSLQYDTVVQNLRLIKAPGESRWSSTTRKWSEMALGQDAYGRMVFIFTRVPFTMAEWNRRMLALPLMLTAVQHLEGGSEAQFFLRLPGEDVFEVGGWLGSSGGIPNVIGVEQPK